MRWRWLNLTFPLLLTISCSGHRQAGEPPVAQQSAADEILRVGTSWSSVLPEHGILSPPSTISVFKNETTSRLRLTADAAEEQLSFEEHLQLRAGGEVHCLTQTTVQLQLRYGRRHGEAAVEIVRPALHLARSCQGAHPEDAIQKASERALFVLRADALVAVEPALEKRKYLPIVQ